MFPNFLLLTNFISFSGFSYQIPLVIQVDLVYVPHKSINNTVPFFYNYSTISISMTISRKFSEEEPKIST